MSFELHTKRLLLRPWLPEDAWGMYELNQAKDVHGFTGDPPFRNLEEVETLIKTYDQYEKFKMGRFTVIEKATGSYAGWCGLKYNETSGETDLGYRILPSFRGRGFATEAANACLEYGFSKLGLQKIIGRSVQGNTASIAILQKIGMTFEKKFEAHESICEQYKILKTDWFNIPVKSIIETQK